MTGPRGPGLLLEAGLVVAWSSGFIGAKLAIDTPSAFLVLFWRFAIVATLLAPFVVQAVLRDGRSQRIGLHLLLGTLAMFAYLACGVKAMDLGVSAGLAALISALQPLATAALAGFALGERVRGRQWLGLAVGFCGVAIAVGGAFGGAPPWAYGLALLGTASLVVATLVAKATPDATPLLSSIGIQSAASAALFAPLALAEGGILPLADAGFLAAVAWFILFSTLGGYGFYWLCLRRSTATRVASLIYLTPPVTMLWAWSMFAEPLAPAAVAGFVLCLIGVGLARASSVPGAASPGAEPRGPHRSSACSAAGQSLE